jgi:hypothetical protein
MSIAKKEVKVDGGAAKSNEAAPVKRGVYRGNRYKPSAATVVALEPKFGGKYDGFVYDCSDGKHSDRFNIVTKEIAKYVGREYAYGGDIRGTIPNLKHYVEEEPEELGETKSIVKKRMFEKRVDEFIKRETKLKENCQAPYSLVLGQCTECMRAKLEAVVRYNDMDSSSDLIELIKTIKGLSYQFEGQQSKTRGWLLAHKRFHQLIQTREMTDDRFLEKFLTAVSVLEQYGGTIGRDEGTIEDEIEEADFTLSVSAAETKTASDVARNKFLAMTFIHAVDKLRYGKILDKLENDFTKGTDNYPESVTRAYHLVVNHRGKLRVVS